jgi:hypothetical protein
MTFTTKLEENADGECYLVIPPELGWQLDDEVEITVMTDLDTDLPCLLVVNHSDRSRKIDDRVTAINDLL